MKRLSFNGKELKFEIDSMEIINGKLPSDYEITDEYVIDPSSLGKLVAFINDEKVCCNVTNLIDTWNDFMTPTLHIFTTNNFVRKVLIEKEKAEKKAIEVSSKMKALEERNIELLNKVKQFNGLPWNKRLFKTIIFSHDEVKRLRLYGHE
ncbi:hypothetical protein [uncultured Bacteroides sp.]|uniref:hypothetical protein n=1 Tax=uncultured Bacteroides sp. TaxID=162156 RepID=UPI0025D787BD|nr:hypothetical protein [uncultured Bacteroides sp.]